MTNFEITKCLIAKIYQKIGKKTIPNIHQPCLVFMALKKSSTPLHKKIILKLTLGSKTRVTKSKFLTKLFFSSFGKLKYFFVIYYSLN